MGYLSLDTESESVLHSRHHLAEKGTAEKGMDLFIG